MTPPEAPANGSTAASETRPPAVSVCLETLKKRADFLACARARKQATDGFILQGRRREDDGDCIRIGYTASKKVGNAVARNRAKRRLREIARLTLPDHGTPGWDYVLVARREATATLPFDRLVSDLENALARIHAPRKPRAPS